MLRIKLERLQTTGIHCANRDCKRNPSYLINILGDVWYLKVDSIVAVVSLGGTTEYYCRECIDELYQQIKCKLDPKLWAFH